jgi:hypothetical protein
MKTLELANKCKAELAQDDFIASQEPVSVEQYIQDRIALKDGVFGALNHIRADGSARKKRTATDFFIDPDWGGDADEGEQPPNWAIGRKKLPANSF